MQSIEAGCDTRAGPGCSKRARPGAFGRLRPGGVEGSIAGKWASVARLRKGIRSRADRRTLNRGGP